MTNGKKNTKNSSNASTDNQSTAKETNLLNSNSNCIMPILWFCGYG